MNAPGLSARTDETPYAGLTPALVLDALDSVCHRGDGRLLQLNSYENRVFQAFLEDGTVVVAKFYRPGRWSDAQILEEHHFSAELAAAEIPVVAPISLRADESMELHPRLSGELSTLATIDGPKGPFRFALTPRRSGRPPHLEAADQLSWIGRFIGRMHAIGAQSVFRHRLTLTVSEFGWAARDWLWEQGVVPPDAATTWKMVVDEALNRVDEAFERASPIRLLRLHGDCHVGNLLWTDAGPHFVDLDDALNGPAMQDLWMLLPSEAAAARASLHALLSGYESFADFDDRELKLIEPLRTLRLIHHSAWLAKRWSDPAFPVAFPWFGGAAYWQQQTQILREQLTTLC